MDDEPLPEVVTPGVDRDVVTTTVVEEGIDDADAAGEVATLVLEAPRIDEEADGPAEEEPDTTGWELEAGREVAVKLSEDGRELEVCCDAMMLEDVTAELKPEVPTTPEDREEPSEGTITTGRVLLDAA